MTCHSIPAQIRAGTTLRVRLTLTAYPADEWTATLIARGPGVLDLVAVADGTTHVIDVPAATTADYPAGRYSYELRVEDGDGVVVPVEAGSLTVVADLSAAEAGHDGSTHAERVLAAVEAVIEGRATTDQERYTIGTRELWRTPIADLLKLRATYRDLVRQERAKAAGKSGLFGRLIRVRLP